MYDELCEGWNVYDGYMIGVRGPGFVDADEKPTRQHAQTTIASSDDDARCATAYERSSAARELRRNATQYTAPFPSSFHKHDWHYKNVHTNENTAPDTQFLPLDTLFYRFCYLVVCGWLRFRSTGGCWAAVGRHGGAALATDWWDDYYFVMLR